MSELVSLQLVFECSICGLPMTSDVSSIVFGNAELPRWIQLDESISPVHHCNFRDVLSYASLKVHDHVYL
jgi:hypothetical protein